MRVAKAKGHLRGKQPKLNPRQEAHLVELLRSGEYTTAEVGDLFGVARSTVYRAVERSKHTKIVGPAGMSGASVSAAGRTAVSDCSRSVSSETRVAGRPAATYRPRHGSGDGSSQEAPT
jgi:hypothetical protein